MTLHEAIQIVLFDAKKPLISKEIAKIINDQKLYFRNDGRDIPESQISIRINQYPELFQTNPNNTISALSIDVTGLLQIKNNSLLNYLRNINLSNSLILPLLYFFKRIIDNPKQFRILYQAFDKQPECDFFGFLKFLETLNNSTTPFNSLLNTIIQEVELNENNKVAFHGLFNALSKIELHLSKVSKDEFGVFYSSVLTFNLKEPHKGGEYYTPVEIIDVIAKIAYSTAGSKVYNPFAGQCSLAVGVLKKFTNDYSFYGEEINPQIYLKGLLNLTINEIDSTDFLNSNSFDQINKCKADICISKPSFADFETFINKHDANSLNRNSRNTILNVIQLIIDSLNPTGRAIIIVPENLLFVNSSNYTEFRNELISKNLIESIISLPSSKDGPFSNVKTSLLVINKSKQSRSIIFFDLNRFKNVKEASKELDINYIIEFEDYYKNLRTNSYDPILDLLEQLYVNSVVLKKGENNLVVSRQLREYGSEYEDVSIKKLKDICEFVKLKSPVNSELYKYVNISDLNRNYFDYKLKASKLRYKNTKGKLLFEDAILGGNIEGSFKPTFFEFSDIPILISNNIFAFSIIKKYESEINLEFLIYELSSKYILNQIEKFSVGATSLKRISKEDLMNLNIKIPSLEEQRTILKNKKDALLAAKIFETREFAESFDIPSLSEKEILGFVSHEFGNINGAIINDLDNLKGIIKIISDKNEILSLDTKITTRTVGEIIDGLASKFENFTSMQETIQNILKSTRDSLKIEPVKIKEFISKQVKLLDDYTKEFHVVYSGEELFDTKDVVLYLDKNQFALVIRNFIINSCKHGYDDGNLNWKNLVFDVNEDADFTYIDMINDGKPFKKDFTLSEFIVFGKRDNDAKKGSGLGGFLMNKVIENHSGKLELLEPASIMVIPNPVDDLEVSQRMIIPGVHFRIVLPKNEL